MKTTIAILALVIVTSNTRAAIHSSASSGSLIQDYVAPPPAPLVYVPRDPYRQIGDIVYTVGGIDQKHGWVEFSGKIWNVQPGGVCIKGVYTGSGSGPDFEGIDFYVANFPYNFAEDEYIGKDSTTLTFYCAKEAGTFTYETAIGGTKTLRKLDYGTIYVPPPPTPEQIEAQKKAAAAAKAKADAIKKAGAEKALAVNQAAADKGDAYGLLRMGERYRDGDGVEKDLAKARDCLQRAAAAGSPTAGEELAKLGK